MSIKAQPAFTFSAVHDGKIRVFSGICVEKPWKNAPGWYIVNLRRAIAGSYGRR
jgi:hypothetical protein